MAPSYWWYFGNCGTFRWSLPDWSGSPGTGLEALQPAPTSCSDCVLEVDTMWPDSLLPLWPFLPCLVPSLPQHDRLPPSGTASHDKILSSRKLPLLVLNPSNEELIKTGPQESTETKCSRRETNQSCAFESNAIGGCPPAFSASFILRSLHLSFEDVSIIIFIISSFLTAKILLDMKIPQCFSKFG